MAQDIPNIKFKSKSNSIEGIDILTIESLMGLDSEVLNHNPEKAHQLEFNILVFFTEGRTRHLVDFVWHEVTKNTVLHLSKGQINAFQFSEDVKGFIMPFTNGYLKNQLNRFSKNEVIRLFNSHMFSPIVQISESSSVLNYVNLFFEEFKSESNSTNKQNVCDNLFSVIFSKLEELKQDQTFQKKHSERLEVFLNFKSLVDLNYIKSRNADFYANKLNITYKHLNAICKEIINTTAKSFIDEYVILEAKRRLINSSIRSNELAYDLGFKEPTNFIKYFKKITGFTPNTFKKQYS